MWNPALLYKYQGRCESMCLRLYVAAPFILIPHCVLAGPSTHSSFQIGASDRPALCAVVQAKGDGSLSELPQQLPLQLPGAHGERSLLLHILQVSSEMGGQAAAFTWEGRQMCVVHWAAAAWRIGKWLKSMRWADSENGCETHPLSSSLCKVAREDSS